jgi:hypothetical protein
MTHGSWLDSGGEPLLLAPSDLLPEWQGARSADYERACRVTANVAPIAIGRGVGLALASRPGATTWRSLPRLLQPASLPGANVTDALLIRCNDRLADDELLRIVAPLVERPFTLEGFLFPTRSPCMLLGSSEPGTAVGGHWLGVMIIAGTYSVSSSEHHLSQGVSVLFHRLTRSA